MFSSASDGSHNVEISNVTVVDAPDAEDEEEMKEHDKLLEDPIELPKKRKFKNLDTVLSSIIIPLDYLKRIVNSGTATQEKTVNITWNTISDQNVC